eukprot:s452_g13.t1
MDVESPEKESLFQSMSPSLYANMKDCLQEVAFRGALFLLLCSIPVIIPDGVSETRDMMMKYGVYNSSVCVFIVFNLGKTFGEAFDSWLPTSAVKLRNDIAISGIKGTVLAAFMGWIMYTISPGGYINDDMDFWLGVVLGSVYVCVVMLLNLNLTLQMFAISNFAGTWMVFLNPKEVAIVTPPWVGDWSLKTDILLQGLVCTAIGFVTVMAAMLLPYPLWSLTYVQENQLVMNRSISKDDNDPLIRAAWWECFGRGRTQLKRQVLHTMDQMSSRVYDLAFNAWTVSTASAHENARLMQKVKPQTNALLDEMENLLLKLVQAISDGQLSPEEGADARLRALEKQLAWEFYEERRTITLNDSTQTLGQVPKFLTTPCALCAMENPHVTRMYDDVRVAQVLQWSISRIAGEIVEVAEGVCKFSTDTNALPPSPESGGMRTIFEGIHDKDHLLYAWRGISSFFLCFLIGYHGFGYKDNDQERYLIRPWSSAIAATAPLLMSMYSGSALVNDLSLGRTNRIQGLMLGNVLARLLGGFVDSCDWADLLFHSLTTFLWTFGGLFVYFHSRTFSTVGVLAAAFGASTLLGVSCGHPDAIGKRTTFDGLMMKLGMSSPRLCSSMAEENCVAFMVTMQMDALFHSNRASDLAYRKLDACYNMKLGSIHGSWPIYESYKSLLDPQEKKVVFRSAQARKLLFEAKQMNEDPWGRMYVGIGVLCH